MKLENADKVVGLVKKREIYKALKDILENYHNTAVIKVISGYGGNPKTADINDAILNASLVELLHKRIIEIENVIKEL